MVLAASSCADMYYDVANFNSSAIRVDSLSLSPTVFPYQYTLLTWIKYCKFGTRLATMTHARITGPIPHTATSEKLSWAW